MSLGGHLVTTSCLAPCNCTGYRIKGFPVLHHLPEFTQVCSSIMSLNESSKKACCNKGKKKSFIYKEGKQDIEIVGCFGCVKVEEKATGLYT